MPIDPRRYELLITPFLTVKEFPIHLLWAGGEVGWHPEESWDTLLSGWVQPYEGAKERLKKRAKELREVRNTGLFYFNLPVSLVFGPR